METLNDLLPGIEEFLITTLANENLSITAEEKRQYFVERLDILKLPPSIPPRPGRRSVHSSQNELDVVDDSVKAVPDDFAAYQRELARTFAQVPPAAKKETKTEHVKIYDDIDSSESTEEDKEHDLYEIPVVRQTEESQPNDSSSVATAASVDDITEEVADNCPPPPLPPRRDRTTSEVTNRSTESICSDKPPDLPARPPLQSRKSDNNNITDKCIKTDKTEKSDNIITDGDSTSYESYDEEEKVNDLALLNKLNIKLPKRAKKESNKLKKKISNSRSSNQLELNVPFKNLSDVVVSGELYYRGKLSWNRRLVALVNGNLVCYKPDKETRPNLAISLPGYEATYSEREGKKGFEIKLYHPNCDAHYFSVDFKEWAQTWCENINKIAQGLPAPGSHQHLARSFIGNSDQAYPSFGGSKLSLTSELMWDGTNTVESTSKLDSKLGSHLSSTFGRLTEGRRSYTLNHKLRNSPISWLFDKRHSLASTCTLLNKRDRLSSSSTLDYKHEKSSSNSNLLKAWDSTVPSTNDNFHKKMTSSCTLNRKKHNLTSHFSDARLDHSSSACILDLKWKHSESAVESPDKISLVSSSKQEDISSGTSSNSDSVFESKLETDSEKTHENPPNTNKKIYYSVDCEYEPTRVSGNQNEKENLLPVVINESVNRNSPDHFYDLDEEGAAADLGPGSICHMRSVSELGQNLTNCTEISLTDSLTETNKTFTGEQIRQDGNEPFCVSGHNSTPNIDQKDQRFSQDLISEEKYHSFTTTSSTMLNTDFESQSNFAVVAPSQFGLTSSTCTEEMNWISAEGVNISNENSTDRDCSSSLACNTRPLLDVKFQQSPLTNLTGSLARWDWKTLFYNWTFPLDHIIKSLRRPELNSSNSNISNASSDGLNEEAKRLKLRGNRVMRMGSFAYRATQFFENLGKKPSGKRKVDCLNKDMKTGIEEECSSSSSGLPLLTPSSDSHEPVFDDLSPLSDLKHAGYLEVFSSFNKRRWGKRYCLVRENMFECYKSEQRKTCELSFQLKTCLLRKAVAETHSEFSLMLLESGKEKITVEVGNKEEMIIWVNVLMRESSNESIPEGLEEYFIDDDHSSDIQDGKEDFSDLLGYSVIKSWDLANEHYKENENSEVVQCNSTEKEESRTKDVYSKVLKTSSTENSSLVPLPGIEESAEVFDEQKLTSDSGFISVHCFNSDSESDSGCAVKSEDESRTYDGKHLHCNDQERDSTSREVTPFDSDSKEITQVGDDSTVESEQTFTDCLDQSEAPVSVRNGMNSNDVVNKKPENVLIDNKTVVNNNNVEKSLVLHLDKDISLDGDKHTDVVYKESDQTPSENSIKQNNAIKDFCLSNVASDNETTNQDLLAVKDSVQNFLEHSTELTEKSSSTSNFSISEKLENNASPAVSSEDEGDTHRYADKLSSSRMEEVSQDSLENKEKSEHNESCKNGKDKNANEEESSNDLKSNTSIGDAADIQLRIKRLREKLVQIKRKRIAVNDKRRRVETDDEKFLCDEEYSCLEEQCRQADSEITRLVDTLSQLYQSDTISEDSTQC